MKRLSSIAVVILFSLSFSGCDLLPISRKGPAKTTSVTRPSGPILAKVNDWALTINEFDQQIDTIIKLNEGDANIPVAALGVLASTFIPPQIDKFDLSSLDGKKLYLEILINQELLAQEAELRGLDRDPDVIKGIRKSTVEILGFTLLNNTLKDIKVTPIEVEDLYNNDYKKTLESIERRKIREIVVDSESKAKDVLVQILTGGNFKKLAAQYSIVESAAGGGLLKVNDQEYLIPQQGVKFQKFWEIAFTLDQGRVSSVFKDPAKTEYYIIKAEDIQKGVPKSLSEVRDDLEYILLQRKSMKSIDGLMSKIKSKFEPNMVIDSSLID